MNEAENRKLALFVGWQLDTETDTWHEPTCSVWKQGMPCILDCGDEQDLPDFYHDEAANRLILVKLALGPHPLTIHFNDGLFSLDYREVHVAAQPIAELNSAIVDAAIRGESL